MIYSNSTCIAFRAVLSWRARSTRRARGARGPSRAGLFHHFQQIIYVSIQTSDFTIEFLIPLRLYNHQESEGNHQMKAFNRQGASAEPAYAGFEQSDAETLPDPIQKDLMPLRPIQ